MLTHIKMAGDFFLVVTPSRLTSSGSLACGDGHSVLHEHLGHVQIRADFERDVKQKLTVVGRTRRHVEHSFDAVDLLLDRDSHDVGNRLGVGAWIGRRHLNHGRRDLGILSNGQPDEGHAADDDNDHRKYGGEDRPVDEEMRQHVYGDPFRELMRCGSGIELNAKRCRSGRARESASTG